MRHYQHFINGQFVPGDSQETFTTINPANGEAVAQFYRGNQVDVNRAVKAARQAFDTGPWPRMSGAERGHYLRKLAHRLQSQTKRFMALEIAESGSTYKKVQGDLFLSVNYLKYFSKLAATAWNEEDLPDASRKGHSQNLLIREPVGVCAQIVPWNFPLMMAIWKLAPALAAGCTVVLKPSEETPSTALELAKLCNEVGIPPGVVNVVTGYGDEVGLSLVQHPGVDKIAFTGSTEVGRLVMAEAAASFKRVTLECGGKSANIILDDADPAIALDGAVYAAFYHSGQCCTAGSRLLIPASQKEILIPQLLERIKRIRVGDPVRNDTDMGPVVSQKQMDRILGYIQTGLDEGATLLTGGRPIQVKNLSAGYFIEPAVFIDVDNRMTIAQEEIFGPVLSVITYADEAEAIRIANDSQYGLAGAVWSRDTQRALRVARQLRTGTVWINEYHLMSERAPFGGYKQSGLGREHGLEGLKAYTEIKHIHMDELGHREKKFWYDAVLKPTTCRHALWALWYKIRFVLHHTFATK